MAPVRPASWAHFVRAAAQASDPARPVRKGRQDGRADARQDREIPRPAGRRLRERPAENRRSPARDLRLLPGACAAWAVAALVIRLDTGGALLLGGVLSLCALCCAAVVVRCRKTAAARVLLIALSVAAMVCLPAAAQMEERSSVPLAEAMSAEAHITVTVRATADPRQSSSPGPDGAPRWLVEAELLEATFSGKRFTANTPVIVLGGPEWSTVAFGDLLRSAGKPLPTEPGSRPAAMLVTTTGPVLAEEPQGPQPLVERLRERFLTLSASTAAPDGGLMPGMVIGARSAVAPDIVATMKATGLTHLTAVSGANCSYVLAFVFFLCRGCRAPRWAAAAAGVAALVGFVILVRPEPSVLRAAVMGAIGVLAVLTGRGRLSMALLFLSIAALLAADPWLSIEYAFILSVAATCGLVLAGPLIAARLSIVLPGWAAQLVAVPLAAQLFCSPVLALIQPDLPTYSLAANVAASPLVPFITIAGMVSVVLVVLAPWAAAPFASAAGWGAAAVAEIARFFASAPHAAMPWPAGAAGAVLSALAGALVLAALAWGPALSASALGRVRGAAGRKRADQPGRTARSGRTGPVRVVIRSVAWIAAGCLLGVLTLWAWTTFRVHGTEEWTVAACDVGQGDGLAVRTGSDSAIVFDAGPEPALMDTCLDGLGVEFVDMLVLTHLHEDHYGGVPGVFEDRTVRRLLYSTSEKSVPAMVAHAAASAGIAAERAASGVAGTAGGVRWSVLAPPPGPVTGSENNASAVVLVTVAGEGQASGLDILFTGDLEEDAADRLLASQRDLAARGVDILKVAHHGARNGGAGIIRALSPRLALISAGTRNDYGHPHPETLEALQSAGVHVARTDLQGTILVTLDGGAMHVRSLR